MKTIEITTYRGFSKVKGNTTLKEVLEHIRNGKYATLIYKINKLLKEGKTDEANNIKRQLSFLTVTSRYKEKRLAESIEGYNDIITIDIDHLSDEQVLHLRPLIEQDPATIACFLTAKQHGFKILAYQNSPVAVSLRETFLNVKEITYRELETYHAQMYELNRIHYEELLNIEVDTSGKDLSRGIFISFDPLAFYSEERAEKIFPLTAVIIPPNHQDLPARKRRNKKNNSSPSTVDIEAIDPAVKLEFDKCVRSTKRIISYKEGNYNNFFFTLGNKCFRKNLDEDMVKALAAYEFGEDKWDTDTPIENSYRYTSKTVEASKADEKTSPIVKVFDFLDKRYTFQRNVVLDRIEMKILYEGEDNNFHVMRTQDMNSIYVKLNEAGIRFSQANLRAVIDSEYAKDFNPFTAYFHSLSPWDKKTDYIGQLADTIQTDDQKFWKDSLRKWIVSLVACATGIQKANQQVLLLHGSQGKGKSTWIQNLLPRILREYYRNGMVNPSNKDDLLMLSTRLIINMEEFEGVRQEELAELKRLITQENITIRKPYDIQAHMYPRRASFIGSTNSMQFLKDVSGSRRFLVFHVKQIDYKTPVNHPGIFSQALYLINDGFRYWFEGKEIDIINSRNEKHRIKDPLEENLYVYFNKATLKDYTMQWKPAASILTTLCINGRTQANAQAQHTLVEILERDGFMKRKNEHGITEYAVVCLTMEEIERNFKRIDN